MAKQDSELNEVDFVANEPVQDQIDFLLDLYKTNRFHDVELECNKLLATFSRSLTVQNLLGAALQGQGKLQQAVDVYDMIIGQSPDYAIAYCNRAVALKALGELEEALRSYDLAILHDPNYAEAYANRGVTLQALCRFEESLSSLDRAIQLNSDNFKTHYNRGNVLRALNRREEALSCFEAAINLAPGFAEAHCNRAVVLVELSRLADALQAYQQAIALKPDYPEVYFSIGNLMKLRGDLDGALANYELAIQQNPEYAEAHCNLGVVLEELGRIEAALQSYERAIALQPDNAEAHSNRGVALQELTHLDEALHCFNTAIQLQPSYTQAFYNRANVMREMGQLHKALENHSHAIALRPQFAEAFANRGNVFQDLGQLDEASQDYSRAIELSPDYELAYTSLLMLMNYMPQLKSEVSLVLAREYGRLVRQGAATHYCHYHCDPNPENLRIGLVSGDFHNHPVGFLLENFLNSLKDTAIEVIAYPSLNFSDQLTARIKPYFSQWVPIYGLNDKAAAARIHDDGIHILIDLSGHTQNNRLPVFAFKPAPVQVTWLGYFATTGIEEIDYILGDPHVTPEGSEDAFTETVWRLPASRWCASEPSFPVSCSALPGVENGYITFGCFGNYTKINDDVLRLWSDILLRLPESKLLLKTKQFRDQHVVEEALARFSKLGIDEKRLIVEQPESRDAYFEAYNRIDITLDTFPFTGGTTSVDSLWMGVPVITLAGDSLVSRQGVGLLCNAGLPDWVAQGRDDYLAKAVIFASELDDLATLRQRLRAQLTRSPLFDAPQFARHFEQAMFSMWDKYDEKTQGS